MRILLLLFITMLSLSCNTHKRTADAQKEYNAKMAHSSKNSVDWKGTYRGVLPCEDCEGIQIEIILSKNNTYEIAKRYEGRSSEVIVEKGLFRWSSDGNKITLYASNNTTAFAHYLVQENQLLKLDNNAEKVQNEFAEMYVLKKKGYDDTITEKYWQLIELNGKAVVPLKGRQQLHVKLKRIDSSVFGYGGCNKFFGHFELMQGNRIAFTKMGNTLIACNNGEQELAFLKVFEQVDHYTIKNDTLSLAKARMASMAKFVAIYMR